MNTSVMMTAAMEKAMVSSTTEFARVMVRALSEKYGFDEAEAVSFLELSATKVSRAEPKSKRVPKEKKEKVVTPSLPLPFCGVVMDGWCKGIRPNHELFTQCTKGARGGSYCATCAGQAASNDTEKPTHGDIRDRALGGGEWRSPGGKRPANYGNVMKKRNIGKDAAVAEAATFGWVIPEEEFEVKVRKAGRPKSPSTSDTEDETPKKKRGRPSKKKALVSGDGDDDLIDTLVSNTTIVSDDILATDEEVPVVETKKKAELSEEEVAAKKAASEAKRKATAAKKKAAKEAALVAKAEEPEVEAEAVSSEDELSAEADGDESDEDEDDATGVVLHEFNGKTYYRDEDTNELYEGDMEDPDLVGTWDAKNKCIVAAAE